MTAIPSSLRVAIRTDANVNIGAGHAMRCLTLAHELRRRGAAVWFSCRDLDGNMSSVIESKGFNVFLHALDDPRTRTEQLFDDWQEDAAVTVSDLRRMGDADWVVVDHYGLDHRWEARIAAHAKRVFVIDDLANRRHDCQVLLDQNYYVDADTRYEGLVPAGCATLLGPGFALLRPEFLAARHRLRTRDGKVRRILVSFGGSDPGNLTQKTMLALNALGTTEARCDILVGGSNPNRDRIRQLCERDPRFAYHCQVDNMAELVASADLGLGAGGATTWERCFLGLPTITIALAENQVRTTVDLSEAGACWYLGRAETVTSEILQSAIGRALADSGKLLAMSSAAQRIAAESGVLGTDLAVDALMRNTSQ
jgi:UDP-2,4-diacetamido-2,4,6-trideoxy-beta-L-altropyranose hydrolase